jgi:site-specific recombinase XerD
MVLYVQGKGRDKKDQHVVLVKEAYEPLSKYLSTREPILRRKLNEDDPLFAGIGNRALGERMTTRAIHERISYYFKKAGIKREKISPHSLRHTAALLAIEGGAPIPAVKKMMRHGTVATTLIYFRKKKKKISGEDFIKL